MRNKKSISILVVEDEQPKYLHIKNYLEELCANAIFEQCKSVSSALNKLEDELPDLLILDMSLPTFDISEFEKGGRPQGFGGIEILRSMLLEKHQCPTIIITGYPAFINDSGETVDLEELSKELLSNFNPFLKGTLHFNSTFSEWRVKLKKLLIKEGLIEN